MADEQTTIWARRGELERERREFMRQAMAEFDRVHYVKLRALQEECGGAGHSWRFTHVGPLGNPWFTCTACRKSEAREG